MYKRQAEETKDDKPAEETKDESAEKKATGYDDVDAADEVENKATGYDDKPVEEDKPAEETKEDKPAEEEDSEKSKKEILEVLADLPKENQDVISEFAIKNKLTPSQVKAYAETVKQEHQEIENARIETRKKWVSELKSDPDFGGEVFNQDTFNGNVDKVEKVLEKHFPNMKKTLTAGGTMLPPYIMRDFLALSKTLNPTTKLVNGVESNVEEKKGHFLEDMYQ